MRIQVRLPRIQPDEFALPEQCPYEDCLGDTFKPHGRQGETKAVRDTDFGKVQAHRYRCASCGRTFRVYPTGVSPAQQSDRLKAMSVLVRQWSMLIHATPVGNVQFVAVWIKEIVPLKPGSPVFRAVSSPSRITARRSSLVVGVQSSTRTQMMDPEGRARRFASYRLSLDSR
jgi:hypothetical protein